MLKLVLLISFVIFNQVIFACDSPGENYQAFEVVVTLQDSTKIQGLFLLDSSDSDTYPLGSTEIPPRRQLKNGDRLFPFYKSKQFHYPHTTITIAMSYTQLLWGYYFIEDDLKTIPVDSLKDIIYQSVNESEIFRKQTIWNGINRMDLSSIQKGMYGLYIIEDPLSSILLICTNPQITRKELELYGLCLQNGIDEGHQNTINTIFNKQPEIFTEPKYRVFNFNNKKYGGLRKVETDFLSRTSELMESYKEPIRKNELMSNTLKTSLLKNIVLAQSDIKLLNSFIETNLGKKDADLPESMYPPRLLEIQHSSIIKCSSNEKILDLIAKVNNPDLLKGISFGIKEGIDHKKILRDKGIVVLRISDLMGCLTD